MFVNGFAAIGYHCSAEILSINGVNNRLSLCRVAWVVLVQLTPLVTEHCTEGACTCRQPLGRVAHVFRRGATDSMGEGE